MLRKRFLTTILFLSCFAFSYPEESLFNFTEENPFGLDNKKIEIIQTLCENEGILNDWFKGCLHDLAKYVQQYDKIKDKKTEEQLKTISIKTIMFATLCSALFPDFNDNELDQYLETSKLNNIFDNISKETSNYVDNLGEEIIREIGFIGESDKKILNKYVDITINSIKEYLDGKKRK